MDEKVINLLFLFFDLILQLQLAPFRIFKLMLMNGLHALDLLFFLLNFDQLIVLKVFHTIAHLCNFAIFLSYLRACCLYLLVFGFDFVLEIHLAFFGFRLSLHGLLFTLGQSILKLFTFLLKCYDFAFSILIVVH